MEVRVRIAPSPTGVPHIGNTRTALYNYLFCRKNNGKFIIRIEDTDKNRQVPGSQEKILKILEFLDLTSDEGPYIQSQRLPIYQKWATKLIKENKAYYCFCAKERLAKLRIKGHSYDRHCLSLKKGEIADKLASKKYVIRFKIPRNKKIYLNDLVQGKVEFDANILDDQILIKSDGFPTYHLAATVDDHLMEISHVIRGVEWLSSTPKHLLLYQAFGWKPPVFAHLPIILGPDKSKLSKRHGAKSVLDYQDEGYLPEAIINFMVFLGWSYKDNSDLLTLEQLVKIFDLSRVRRANPIFDIKKLDWFNSQWIKKLTDAELLARLKPYLTIKLEDKILLKIIPLIKTRIIRLTQAENLIDFFQKLPEYNHKPLGPNKEAIQEVKTQLEKLENWSLENIKVTLNKIIEKNKWDKGKFFMALRVAITGKTVTPPLLESMEILGKKEILLRLNKAL